MVPSSHLAALILQYRYAALVPLAFITQPAVALLTGVLIRYGYFDLLPAYLAVVSGAVLGDIMWYYIGYHFGDRFARRFGRYFGMTEAKIETVKHIFNRHDSRILILSKVTNGLGLAVVTLFTAGLSRISFSRYVLFNAIGEGIWTGSLIGIGILFSQLYDQVNGVLGKLSVLGLFVLATAAFIAFVRYLYARFVQEDL